MFLFKKQTDLKQTIGCCLLENGYSLAIVRDNKQVLYSKANFFIESELNAIPEAFASDIDRLDILGQDATFMLVPGQYQLILMDALDIPETEMNKALRWNLKGLSDYDLNDIVIDACLVPKIEDRPQKTFVAITSLSELKKKLTIFASAFLNITSATITEMGLKNLLPLMKSHVPAIQDVPIIMISRYDNTSKLHIIYHDLFYLIREFSAPQTIIEEPDEITHLTLEIYRSIDFCTNQLNLPKPSHLFFTPDFYHVADVLGAIGQELALTVKLIDLNDYLEIEPPLALKKQSEVFYAITAALVYTEET